MKSYTIHLIRHGISQGNLLGQYIGVTDSPLSKEGTEQLKQLAEQNSYPYAQAYYTPILSSGWKAVLPCLRPEGKMEATLCSASVWSLKHLWNV